METAKYEYDDQTQLFILATLVRDHKFVSQFQNVIRPNYFDLGEYTDLCRLVYQFYDKYKQTPTYSSFVNYTHDWLKGVKRSKKQRAKLVTALEEIYHVEIENAELVKEMAVNFAKQQEYFHLQEKGLELVSQGRVDAALELMGQVRKIGVDLTMPINYATETISKEEESWERHKSGIPGLDRVTGGIKNKQYAILVGMTNGYKTGVAVNLVRNYCRKGKNIVVFCNEQDESEWQSLLDCSIMKLTHGQRYKLNKDKKRLNSMRKKVRKYFTRWGSNLFIKYLPYARGTVSQMEGYIEQIQAAHGIKIDGVVVDSLDGCTAGLSGDQWGNEVEVYKEFESMLGYLNIWGWSTLQMNFKGESSSQLLMHLSQLRGRADKAFLAAQIVGINMRLPKDDEDDEDLLSMVRRSRKKQNKPVRGFMVGLKSRNCAAGQVAKFTAHPYRVGFVSNDKS